MKRFKIQQLILLVTLSFLFFSCDDEDFIEPSSDSTFSIRHDRSLSEYESKAASTSSDLPNFSSVVAFSYSLDGSNNREFVASGVLIDQEWILTAAHNFYDSHEQIGTNQTLIAVLNG